jgi:hypothetical protein
VLNRAVVWGLIDVRPGGARVAARQRPVRGPLARRPERARVNITATRRRSSATTTTRSSQRRYGRANPAEQRASSSLSAKEGPPQLGSACTSQARHANSRDQGTPARARKSPRVPDVCKVGKGRRRLQAFRRSPLTDSNRRPLHKCSMPTGARRRGRGSAVACLGLGRALPLTALLWCRLWKAPCVARLCAEPDRRARCVPGSTRRRSSVARLAAAPAGSRPRPVPC